MGYRRGLSPINRRGLSPINRRGLSPIIPIIPIILGVLGVAGCGDQDVGVPCQMSNMEQSDVVSVAVDALDCRSRLCLFFGGSERSRPLCTRTCERDADCGDETPACPQGFRCGHAKAQGAAGCCKLCICRGFLAGEPTGLEAYCQGHPNPSCPGL